VKYTIWQENVVTREAVESIFPLVEQVPLAKMLAQKPWSAPEELADFLHPSLAHIQSPYLLKDMHIAKKIILDALTTKRTIAVWADYDVDGIVSATIMYETLKALGCEDIIIYFPHREEHGYGLHPEGIAELHQQGATLLITVDCGSTNHEEVNLAKSLGMQVVITDHHHVQEHIPDADAFLNPQQPGCEQAYKGICGAFVAWKLCWALQSEDGLVIPSRSREQFPLLALATVADVVPLLNENRVVVLEGLRAVRTTNHIGILALLQSAGLTQSSLTEYDFSHRIAPRLNAAGRIAHATASFRILITKDPVEAKQLAGKLEQLNTERRSITDRCLLSALEQAKEHGDTKALVVRGKDWPPGIVGLLASRLVDLYAKPALAIGFTADRWVGSARSLDCFHITEALGEVSDYLLGFGGHAKAAGFSMTEASVDIFTQRFLELAERSLTDEELMPRLSLDVVLDPKDITGEFFDALQQLAPFGMGNRKPVFALYGCTLLEKREVGSTKEHIKLKVAKDGMVFTGIAFGLRSFVEEIVVNDLVDIAFYLETNTWNGVTTLQLSCVDMRLMQ